MFQTLSHNFSQVICRSNPMRKSVYQKCPYFLTIGPPSLYANFQSERFFSGDTRKRKPLPEITKAIEMEPTKTHRYKNLCRSIDFVFGPKKYFLNLREGRKEIFVRIGELYLDSTKNKSHEIYMSISVAKFLLEELREITNVIKKNEGTSPEQKKLLYEKKFFDENNGQVYILELMVRSQEFLGKLGEMTLCIIEESINDKTKKTVFFIPSKGIPIFQKKLSMILKIYDERLKSDKNRDQQEQETTKIEEPKE